MHAFAVLLDRLYYTSSRLGKEALLRDYFRNTPDPDRGWALAALTGELDIPHLKPAYLRELVTQHIDEYLYRLCRDYVGDSAETVALLWDYRGTPRRFDPDTGEVITPSPLEGEGRGRRAYGGGKDSGSESSGFTPPPDLPPRGREEFKAGHNRPPLPTLSDLVDTLHSVTKKELEQLVPGWLDAATPTERWAMLKFILGNLRIGVSARLTKQVLSQLGDIDVNEIENVWHAVKPPYTDLFAWLEKRGPKPDATGLPVFHPVMLSHPIEDGWSKLDPAAYQAEWKWDGIRVQLVATHGQTALYTRTGDDISHSYPDLLAGMDGFDVVLDGELLVRGPKGEVKSFNDLQQRLGRKTPGKKMMQDLPVYLRAYDLLMVDGEDWRDRPLIERREKLEHWHAANPHSRIDLSEVITFQTMEELLALRDAVRGAPPSPLEGEGRGRRADGGGSDSCAEPSGATPPPNLPPQGGEETLTVPEAIDVVTHPATYAQIDSPFIEGLMLKRKDSLYVPGRPKGPWYKWKRDALTIDAVLLYAQRGSGKRSSFYSDFTFGLWQGDELLPVAKAYSGYTDEELKKLDKWIRGHTTERFGPVRQVAAKLVMELAFDSVHESKRHKSGVAMRFPRIHRIRWDKPAEEADQLVTLKKMIG